MAGWEHRGPGHRTSGPQQIGVMVLSDPRVPGLLWAHFVHSILGHSAPWVPGTLIATCFSYRFLRPVSLVHIFSPNAFFGHTALGLQRFRSPEDLVQAHGPGAPMTQHVFVTDPCTLAGPHVGRRRLAFSRRCLCGWGSLVLVIEGVCLRGLESQRD